MNWFSGIFDAIGAVFGWIRDRQKLNNSPEMQKAKEAQKQVNVDNEISKEVQNADDEAIRKRISP